MGRLSGLDFPTSRSKDRTRLRCGQLGGPSRRGWEALVSLCVQQHARLRAPLSLDAHAIKLLLADLRCKEACHNMSADLPASCIIAIF
jgi:hypothetical protein